jgi:hypothetical protein
LHGLVLRQVHHGEVECGVHGDAAGYALSGETGGAPRRMTTKPLMLS